MGKKRRRTETEVEESTPKSVVPSIRSSDEPAPKKVKWTNRQRVLVFAARRISYQARHLMEDLRNMMPQSRPDSKMERKDSLFAINEICEMKNCQKCLFFEGRKKGDLFMWLSRIPQGPAVKFQVENVHTMEELKFSGNCLKGSRPLLSFDESFDSEPHYSLIKELFIQIFSTPYHHPKSQPFIDHVLTFSILDQRIWFRNYQIMEEDGALVEIGPRFVLNPIKIFGGSFCGETLWSNARYVPPAQIRRQIKKAMSNKYLDKIHQKMAREEKEGQDSFRLDPTDEVFQDKLEEEDAAAQAEKIAKFHQMGREKGSGKKRRKNNAVKKNELQNGWNVEAIA